MQCYTVSVAGHCGFKHGLHQLQCGLLKFQLVHLLPFVTQFDFIFSYYFNTWLPTIKQYMNTVIYLATLVEHILARNAKIVIPLLSDILCVIYIIRLTHANVWESMGKPCTCIQLLKKLLLQVTLESVSGTIYVSHMRCV